MSLRCFLVSEFIGVHMELQHGHALVIITIVTTNAGTLSVKVDVRVGDPLIQLAPGAGHLEPSMATWLELH